ncbi:MAG: hypothetical protein V1790_18085 [Planctomycetota bacterium]
MRVETREGVLVVFDAAIQDNDEIGCSGFSAYWTPEAEPVTHVFGRVLYDETDLEIVLQSLHRDFGVDVEELGSRHVRLTKAMKVRTAHAERHSAWEPLTLDRAVEIMGFDPSATDDSQDGRAQVTCACQPCAAGVPPPSRCDSPYALVREGLAVTADCCGCGGGGNPPPPPPPPPTSCVCCPVLGFAAEGSDSTTDGMGSVAVVCCVGRVCDDGDPCTQNDLCDNEAVSCPPLTCCGVPKVCADDGDVCTLEQCVGGACESQLRCSGRVCCPAGPSYFCCNTGEEVCCPSNPGYADHCCPPERPTCCDAGCCLSTQTCCPGGTECCNPDQTCCNGHCGLKGACCFFDTGLCSELIETCCAQQGGTYQGDGTTCTPGDLCRPKCENCHSVSLTFYECGHYVSDPLGPCAQDECFENVMLTASCDSFPYRKGPARCDTYEIVGVEEFISKSYWLSIPEICETTNPGGFHPWQELYFGCGETCDLKPDPPTGVRCDTGPCGGRYFVGGDEKRGTKKACGCPPP